MKDRNSERIRPIITDLSFRQSLGANRKYVIASLIVHFIVFTLMLMSWKSSEPTRVNVLPQSVQARVLTPSELDKITEKKRNEEAEAQRRLDAKRKAERLARELEEKKRREQVQRQKEKAKAKAEAQRKLELERKKVLAQKKEEEQKRKALQEKREEEQRAREEAEAKLKREEKRKEQEQKLAERLKNLELEAQQRQRDQERRAAEEARQAAFEQEMSERDRFLALIQSRVEDRWHVPPSARGLSVELHIRLLPTGELAGVKLSESSGNTAMDQSAISAVRSIRRFPVPEESVIFEKYFRSFSMRFRPSL